MRVVGHHNKLLLFLIERVPLYLDKTEDKLLNSDIYAWVHCHMPSDPQALDYRIC